MPEEETPEGSERDKEVKEGEEAQPEEKREEIKIKDYSIYKPCAKCGEIKVPYIELEVDGKIEATCRECYEGKYTEPKEGRRCPSCATAAQEGDNFCAKCGDRLHLICPTCGMRADLGDKYCRQCGSKL
jgi:hypothetical protein